MEKQKLEQLLIKKFGKDYIEEIKKLEDFYREYTEEEIKTIMDNLTHVISNTHNYIGKDVYEKFAQLHRQDTVENYISQVCTLRRVLFEINNKLFFDKSLNRHPSALNLKNHFEFDFFDGGCEILKVTRKSLAISALEGCLVLEIPADRKLYE